MTRHRGFLLAAFAFSISGPALALTPTEIFDKVSPSIWAVRALDAQARPFSQGSAVVVGPSQLVTNCHVLAKAKAIEIRRENAIYEARLQHADVERDLCLLFVRNFGVPAVEIAKMGELRVGQRVYAIGNPEGLSLSLSEGLLSGLRGVEGAPILQTTAPISPGSSGGGLFDDQGRLVGITTLIYLGRSRIAQSLNFAMPAEWIAEVPERGEAQLAQRKERSAPLAAKSIAGYPAVGTSWIYSFQDRKYSSAERRFTIRIEGMEGQILRESFVAEGGDESSESVDPAAARFSVRRLPGNNALVELAPYFLSGTSGELPDAMARTSNYPDHARWRIRSPQIQAEDAVVPAGTYTTVRVDVFGTAPSYGSGGMSAAASVNHIAARFHYTAWYAPEVGRYVMVRHKTWNSSDNLIGDELIQLLEFRSP